MKTRSGGLRLLSFLVGVVALVGCEGTAAGPPGGSGGAGGSAPVGGAGGAPAGAGDQALPMLQAQIAAAQIDKSQAAWRTSVPRPTVVPFAADKRYLWI